MEKIEILKDANRKLGLSDNILVEKNKNLIIVYCPPKVGSTSLVSSIRLSCANKVTILHIHDELMLNVLCGIQNITINEIIQYNQLLGKNVTVIDIYRTPIEHKISTFFEKITYHFNNTEENINHYDINIIIRRFNQLFPFLSNTDYYQQVYPLSNRSDQFDFNKYYLLTENLGVKYIKLRLQDANTLWSSILKQTLGLSVHIVKDYDTERKVISPLFKQFKNIYKIPANLFDLVINTPSLSYYLKPEEKTVYISNWTNKKTEPVELFTQNEYRLYSSLCQDNRSHYVSTQEVHPKHYIDEGCCCQHCSHKRTILLTNIRNGKIPLEKDYIIHSYGQSNHVNMKEMQRRRNLPFQNIIRNRPSKYTFSTKIVMNAK